MTIKTIIELKSEIEANLANNTTNSISPADIRQAMLNMCDSLMAISGWSSYIDTEYPNSGSAFTVSANTDTILPNNAGSTVTSKRPIDINAFYSPASLSYDGGSSAFTVGETVTGGTSGATATIIDIIGDATSGILFLGTITGTFTDNETITDGATGSALANGSNGNGKIIGRNGDSLDAMLYFKAVPSAANQWIDIWVDIGGGIGELYRQTFEFPKGSGTERGILYALPSAYTLNTWEANGGDIYVRSNANLDIYGINFNFDRCYKTVVES